MKKNTQDIINCFEYAVTAIVNGLQTPDTFDTYFKSRFTKEDLKECLTDPDLDAEDLESVKEMLKYFFKEEYSSIIN